MVAVHLKVKRYDPEVDKKPRWQEYEVEVDSKDRVLDALHEAKWHHDGTLTFRRSCAHGVCGSDAMIINGQNGLACGQLIENVGTDITLEPIRGLPVIKDLVVDMEPFFAQYRSILPYLINGDDPGYKERYQSADDRERFDDTTKCILCACCTTSCPVYWGNSSYVGPAAIVERAPVHLRLARPGGRAAPRHPERDAPASSAAALRSTAPTPAPRHQGHPGHRRGQAGDPVRPGVGVRPQRPLRALPSVPRRAARDHRRRTRDRRMRASRRWRDGRRRMRAACGCQRGRRRPR